MRHQVFGKKLNRDVKERKALFKSLVLALIKSGKIKTSLARAKAVSRLVEKLVTKAKNGSEAAINQLSSFLNRKEAVDKLVKEVAPKFKTKVGGYLRIRRVNTRRKGDATEEVLLEWSEDIKMIEKEDRTKIQNKKRKNEKSKSAVNKNTNK